MSKIKVHFCGGEGINWALDHDLQHLRRLMKGTVKEVEAEDADIIHSVWWKGLLQIPQQLLRRKIVIGSIADHPHTLMSSPEFLLLHEHVTAWLCEYYESLYFVENCGFTSLLFPDPIDMSIFKPPYDRPFEKRSLCAKIGVSEDMYLIGNFHRDSSMSNLKVPKKQKGADFLLEIATGLKKKRLPVHFVLAGPRRHYLREQFNDRSIPFTYLGEKVETDDCTINTLGLQCIANIMRSIDLYLITSRWEGAPNAVLEASASLTKVLSTPVGQSPDILSARQIFRTTGEVVELIERDVKEDWLRETLASGREHIYKWNRDEAICKRLEHIYKIIREIGPKKKNKNSKKSWSPFKKKRIKIIKEMPQIAVLGNGQLESIGGLAASQKFHVDLLRQGLNRMGILAEENRANAFLIFDDARRNLSSRRVSSMKKRGAVFLRVTVELNSKINADAILYPSGWHLQKMQDNQSTNRIIWRTTSSSNKFDREKKNFKEREGRKKMVINQGYDCKLITENLKEEWELTLIRDGESFPSEGSLYVATEFDFPGSCALHGALAQRVPVLYQKTSLMSGFFEEILELGGRSFSDENSFKKALCEINEYYEAYRNVVWPDDLEESIEKLIEIYSIVKSKD